MSRAPTAALGWLGIVRLGLVQAALGGIVVLTTSTLNRVMVVELLLPATLPGALVALHYAVQLGRPAFGHGSDASGRRTPWILGGMAVLGTGGFLAALATALLAVDSVAGLLLALLAFLLIGGGVGSAGTALLALLAARVDDRRRAAAATVVWMMMILGFALTAGIVGRLLEPFSLARLVLVTGGVCLSAVLLSAAALLGVEGPGRIRPAAERAAQPRFRAALAEVWADREARRFTIFVFLSMLAYSAQDLVLEPFAGLRFDLSPGETTKLSGVQHAGVLVGMILVAIAATLGGGRLGALRLWTIGGCLASAGALAGLAAAGILGPPFPLRSAVFVLGIANGAFAIAAIGSMMALAGEGRSGGEGVRMGLWGAAQAIAFALGGFLGTLVADLGRLAIGSAVPAYVLVFILEALLFVLAARLAARIPIRGEEASSGPAGPLAVATGGRRG
jgi:BCD family chlorophyll transporter-like MFS transporter